MPGNVLNFLKKCPIHIINTLWCFALKKAIDKYPLTTPSARKVPVLQSRAFVLKNTVMQKIIPTTIAVFLGCIMILAGSPAMGADRYVHHRLEIVLLPQEQKLEGRAWVSLPEAEKKQRLHLNPQARVASVRLNGQKLSYSFSQGLLEVELPREAAGSGATLQIDYKATLDDEAPGSVMHTEDPTYGVAGAITPDGTFLSGGSGWYPDPRQGPATWELRVETPAGYLAVTAGSLREHTTTEDYSLSRWQVDVPLPGLTVSAGPYEIKTDKAGDIPVSTYFYPESQDLAGDYLEAARSHLEFFQAILGPYPFEKFAVVENFFPTGYGLPSWTLLGSRVIRLPFIKETSLPHEIAHSWWGNGVRVDYREGNWSEAVTTYVADYLLLERESEEEAQEYRERLMRNFSSLISQDKDFPLKEFTRRDSRESQAIGYGKGAMVFHMLRLQVGEQEFWEGLRRMVREYMFDSAGWSDFEGVFSEVADDHLQPFFEQWVQRPGAPFLFLEDVQISGLPGRWTISGTIRQAEPAFDLRLPVHIETPTQRLVHKLHLDSREKTFEFQARSRPSKLLADPYFDVFRRLHPEEMPATVERVRGSSDLTAIMADGLSSREQKAARLILQALNRGDVTILSEEEARQKDLTQGDLLFMGMPARDLGAALYEQAVEMDVQGLEEILEPGLLRNAETALFAALNPQQDPERVLAYFAFGSEDAARDAARRISHYGRYSYLFFQDGENRAKGTWEQKDFPLQHDFDGS